MIEALDEAESRITNLLDSGIPGSKIVIISEHPAYRGYLQAEPFDADSRGMFYGQWSGWMSRHMVLNELFLAERFERALTEQGIYPVWTPSAQTIRDDIERWSRPLEVPGYSFRPFQSFALNRALERARQGKNAPERFYFFNWSAGAGKSFCCGAAARVLLESGDIDLVIACTLSKLKENLRRFFASPAGLDAVITDGAKSRRRKIYKEDHQVYVMNYEKLWADSEELTELISGRKVLWILDEGHKVITDNGQNRARKSLDLMSRSCEATVWPMSATVVGGNPLRYRDVFSLDGYPSRNPLGTKTEFIRRYADTVRSIPVKTPKGRAYAFTAYEWNLRALHDVRHRVGDRTMAIRKTDPGVREQFRGMDNVTIPVQATSHARELLERITDRAREARTRGESLAVHYTLARIACINPGALRHSSSPEAKHLTQHYPLLVDAAHSSKIEILNDMLEGMRESQDKAVVFCHWTEMGILPLARHIKVPHVLHHGAQTAAESQEAQDRFKSDPDITAFVSSDAGTHGLNLQEARYVINLDPTYSYDDLAQRNARIDRADSHLNGLTAYVMVTEDTVEERVWQVCEERRQLAAAVQGTSEELSYGDDNAHREENRNLEWLLFGKDT